MQVVKYFTAPVDCVAVRLYCFCPSTNGGAAYFDDIDVEEIGHGGTDGVHIVSALGGSIRNWASIESTFDYNDTAYVFDVNGSFFTVEVGDGDVSWNLVDTAPIRYSVSLSLREV